MRAPSFLILTAVTLLVTVAAGIAAVRQEDPRTAIETGGPVLPGLVDRLADVTAILIRDSGNSLTVRKIEGGWALTERSDYPVPPDRVRALVRSVVQLERSEAKTVRPDRYARLGVEDVDAPNSKSKEIVLQTASGTPVAKLIVGTAASGF